MPAISSRSQQRAGRDRRQLGRGARDDHLAAGRGGRAWAARSAACAPGRRADVVIWSGDPLEGDAAPPRRCSSTASSSRSTTSQTRLRDRYRDLPRARRCPKRTGSDRAWRACACSAIAFVGTHFLLSHPLREPLVAQARREGRSRASIRWSRWPPSASMIWVYRRDRPTSRRCGTPGEACWIVASAADVDRLDPVRRLVRRQSGAARARGSSGTEAAAACSRSPATR